MSTIVYLGGNNYNRRLIKPFLTYLKACFGSVIYIELLENKYADLPYRLVNIDSYNKYIYNSLPDKDASYVFFGTSMGCYHIQNFIAKYPELCAATIWLEPTMAGGDYGILHMFEQGRGNGEWLTSLRDNINDPNLPTPEKVMDIAVSKGGMEEFDRNIKLGIIYTTRDNKDEVYNPEQVLAKQLFLKKLKEEGYVYKYILINAPHTADLDPQYFSKIVEFIRFVLSDSN